MGILDIIAGPVMEVIDKFVPDADKKIQARLELAKIADAESQRASAERIAQAEVNKVEAGSSSLFVAGWRPAVGWACVVGFSYATIISPAFGLASADTTFLRDVLLGMLGINVLARSVEKVKGVAQNTLTGQSNEPVASVPAPEKKAKKKILGIAPWPF
jgi:hypothetical protein